MGGISEACLSRVWLAETRVVADNASQVAARKVRVGVVVVDGSDSAAATGSAPLGNGDLHS